MRSQLEFTSLLERPLRPGTALRLAPSSVDCPSDHCTALESTTDRLEKGRADKNPAHRLRQLGSLVPTPFTSQQLKRCRDQRRFLIDGHRSRKSERPPFAFNVACRRSTFRRRRSRQAVLSRLRPLHLRPGQEHFRQHSLRRRCLNRPSLSSTIHTAPNPESLSPTITAILPAHSESASPPPARPAPRPTLPGPGKQMARLFLL